MTFNIRLKFFETVRFSPFEKHIFFVGTKNLAEILSERDTIAQVMQGGGNFVDFWFEKEDYQCRLLFAHIQF